jgi:poly(A) polymerase
MTGAARLSQTKWLGDPPLAKLLAVLDGDGEEARVVGGAVRNVLLNLPPGEIDIATTAVPEVVVARAEQASFKAVPTGIEHGTITVVVDGRGFEVTTLREDVETFGRKARVRFGRSWRHDAERRDFTMNALSVSRDGTLYDCVGGLDDLRHRRVRFIGDPATRIAEDYLRILRFFRFHASYGRGDPDPAGVRACIAGREGLAQLSRERIRAELVKLLIAPGAAQALTIMADSGLLDPLLGGVPFLGDFGRMTAIESVLGMAPDASRRLAALNANIVEDADRLRQRLRLTNAEHRRIASMAEKWWRIHANLDEAGSRALLYRLGEEAYFDRVALAWARAAAPSTDFEWQRLATLPKRWTPPRFAVRAADLMARGIPEGARLGKALAAAEEKWIARDFPTDAGAIAAILDAVVRENL